MNQEKAVRLVQPPKSLNRINIVPHKLSVVIVDAIGDVNASESAVHSGHFAQMSDAHNVAANNLKTEAGRPFEIYNGASPVDLAKYRAERMVGVYNRTADTFTYTVVRLEEIGKERLESVVFTTKTPEKVREDIQMIAKQATGQQSEEDIENNNEGQLIQFPQQLRPTG